MQTNGTPVRIRHFTDPMCPFAFAAERQRLRLDWLYGDQLGWTTHMVVLSETPNPDLPGEKLAAGRRMLHERYGMPMAWTPPPEPAASVDACRAVVAARLRSEPQATRLLRRLRVLNFAGRSLGDPETIAQGATEAGLDPEELRAWAGEPATEQALREDMRAARSPSPASRAQDYKLGGPAEERRYTCPSYELERSAPAPADWAIAWFAAAAVLLAAAALKAADRTGTTVALAAFGIPGRLAAPGWATLIVVEAGLAAGIAAGSAAAAYAAGIVLAGFLVAQVGALAQGNAGAPCGCFGAGGRLSRASAARTALLGAVCAALPALGAGPDAPLVVTAAAAAAVVVLALGRRSAPRG